MSFMQLAVFDLDYTIWDPEMYQIDGPPKLMDYESMVTQNSYSKRNKKMFQRSNSIEDGKVVTDQSGTPIVVFDGA